MCAQYFPIARGIDPALWILRFKAGSTWMRRVLWCHLGLTSFYEMPYFYSCCRLLCCFFFIGQFAEMLSGRYADVLSGLFLGYSTLWYTSHHKNVKGLDKVTDFAMQVTRTKTQAVPM